MKPSTRVQRPTLNHDRALGEPPYAHPTITSAKEKKKKATITGLLLFFFVVATGGARRRDDDGEEVMEMRGRDI